MATPRPSAAGVGGPERCPFCGYALRGLPAPHDCPECGRAYDEHTRVWEAPRQWLYYLAPILICLPVAVLLNLYLNQVFYPRGLRAAAVVLASWAVPLPLAIVWMRGLIRRGVLIACTPDGLLARTGFTRLIRWDDVVDVAVVLRRNVYLRQRGRGRSNISHFFDSPTAIEDFRAAVAEARRRAQLDANLTRYARQTGKL